MTQAPTQPVLRSPYPRRRFTSDEYIAMVEVGIISEDEKIELLEGEIVEMSPSSPNHSETIDRLLKHFASLLDRVQLRIQGTTRISDQTVFDPDLLLLRQKPDGYRDALPTPDDILLVIEVAHSSLQYDREVKADIYAKSGIAEYWIVNLIEPGILVHREPGTTGYGQLQTIRPGSSIAPLAFADTALDVAKLLT